MRIIAFAFLTTMTVTLLGGCSNWMARSLGAPPVAQVSTLKPMDDECSLKIPLTADGTGPVVRVYLVDAQHLKVEGPSTRDRIYKVADVTEVVENPYLKVIGSDPVADTERRTRRAVLAMTLMSIADDNGAEYWRRFSALMTYAKAGRATSKAFMGSSIAATFISPVLGASLAGAGLAFDTFTETLTADFDVEMYGALREAVRAEVLNRRMAIISKLKDPDRMYADYPASAVIADVNDYAHIYSLRGAIDALKKATSQAHEKAKVDAKELAAPAAPGAAVRLGN
jgi:hypothetical protein